VVPDVSSDINCQVEMFSRLFSNYILNIDVK